MKQIAMVKDSEGRIRAHKQYKTEFSIRPPRNKHGQGSVLTIWQADGFGWVITASGKIYFCPNPEDVEGRVREFFNILNIEDVPMISVPGTSFVKTNTSFSPIIDCPACGSAKTTKYGTRINLHSRVRRRQCQDCGHVWNHEKIEDKEPMITLVPDATTHTEEAEAPYVSC